MSHAKTGVTTERSPQVLPVMDLGRSLHFRLRVDSSGGVDACWPWTAGTYTHTGYGVFNIRTPGVVHAGGRERRPMGAHRVAWCIANNAEVPIGMVVRHKCDNRICCNPGHLEIGTQRENMRDMVSRGRRNGWRKLSDDDVRAIRARRASGESRVSLAREFKVSDVQITNITKGRAWRSVR